ncbi:MAG TPA: tetratricopeptide repeat protein [Myxococcaceae bacterium]|nr:tetratricopeptide repeat protein [Myxococcaceae bacterium]
MVLLVTGCKTTQVAHEDASTAPVAEVAPPEPPPEPLDPKRAFEQGVAAFQAGRYADAATAFQAGWDRTRDPRAASNLGLSYERLGRLDEAEKAYRSARKEAPEHRAAILGLGRVYRLQGKAGDAVGLYEEALKTPDGSRDGAFFSGLAAALRSNKRYPEAEAAARKALARNKDDPEAYKTLALLYLDQGKYRLAELTCASALKLNDKDPAALNTLGLVHLRQGDGVRALAQFKRAAEVDPRFVPAYLNLGALALAYRDYEAAQKAFGQAATLEPSSADAHLYVGYALDGQKGQDAQKGLQAGAAFERALALRPNLPEALCGAGWAYGADPAGRDKAKLFLEKCQSQAQLSKQERQAVEMKLKTLDAPPAAAK